MHVVHIIIKLVTFPISLYIYLLLVHGNIVHVNDCIYKGYTPNVDEGTVCMHVAIYEAQLRILWVCIRSNLIYGCGIYYCTCVHVVAKVENV